MTMKAYLFLADGFETVEALCVADILRRGGTETVTVSVSDSREVTSGQKITVKADRLFEECDFSDGDAIILPGGIPGTPNLKNHEGLKKIMQEYYDNGKYLAAICAAPSILGAYGFLRGKRATCYPGYEEELKGAVYTGEAVETDGNIITSKGMGTATEFGLALSELLAGRETSIKIGKSIQFLK